MKRKLALALLLLIVTAAAASAGDPTFLWKPESESDGNLVILFPSQYREGDVAAAYIESASRRDSATRLSQNGHNGDRLHARFGRPGESYGRGARVVLVLKNGQSRVWTVPKGGRRYETRDPGELDGDSNDNTGEDIPDLGEGQDTVDEDDEAATNGDRTLTFDAPRVLRVSACLATYGPACLAVTVTSADGQTRKFMRWRRRNDKDSSPLFVDGEAVEESIFEENPGDPSAATVVRALSVRAGDTVKLRLSGDFGRATPRLDAR